MGIRGRMKARRAAGKGLGSRVKKAAGRAKPKGARAKQVLLGKSKSGGSKVGDRRATSRVRAGLEARSARGMGPKRGGRAATARASGGRRKILGRGR